MYLSLVFLNKCLVQSNHFSVKVVILLNFGSSLSSQNCSSFYYISCIKCTTTSVVFSHSYLHSHYYIKVTKAGSIRRPLRKLQSGLISTTKRTVNLKATEGAVGPKTAM